MKIENFYLSIESDEIEVFSKEQLVELFDKSQDKENGSTFDLWMYDLLKRSLLYPFSIKDKMHLTVAELPALYKEYILQECTKVFDGISWVDTEKELENVEHEKLTNLTDTIDLIQFLQIEYYRQVKTRLVYFVELIKQESPVKGRKKERYE